MAFLDKFRAKPEWQHSDPETRLAAVRRLAAEEQQLLASIARQDADASVRLAALKKLTSPTHIADIARGDSDGEVRSEASDMLVSIALLDKDGAISEVALGGITEQRHMATLAKNAPSESISSSALARISDPKIITSVARNAECPSIRLQAVERIADIGMLSEIALKCEHKDASLAAVERLGDREILEMIADRAKNKAAGRRAKAILDSMPPEPNGASEEAPATVEATASGEADRERQEAEARRLAEAEAQAQELQRSIPARVSICETVDSLENPNTEQALENARTAWKELPPLSGADGGKLAERFDRACSSCMKRFDAWKAADARRLRLEEICADTEKLAESDLSDASRRRSSIEEKWKTVVSDGDVPSELQSRFDIAITRFREREAEAQEQRVRHQSENLIQRQHLCDEIEAASASPSLTLKDADLWLRDAKATMENPGPLPSKRDRDDLIVRMDAARKALFARIQELRQDEEWKRWANIGVQEDLCARTEALLKIEDCDEASRSLRDIEVLWKEASQVPKGEGDALWQRFTTARDQVRAQCSAYFAKKNAEFAQNVKLKEALCEKAEALAESADWIRTAEALQKLQAEWKDIGPVPRQASNTLWERFRKPCDHFFTRRKQDREQRTKEWAGNLARKEALCQQGEVLAESMEWEKTAVEFKRLQAEWRTIGPVRKGHSDAVWQRFRTSCDRFFERYKQRGALEVAAQIGVREEIIKGLEAQLPAPESSGSSPASEDIAEKLRAAQTAWRQAAAIPREKMEEFEPRLKKAREGLIAAYAKNLEGTEFDPNANRGKMEKICARVEGLLQELSPGGVGDEASLADQLRNALAANALGGRANSEARWHAAKEEVDAAQISWKRLTATAIEIDRELSERFHKSCKRFFELRPQTERRSAGSGERRG